MPFKLSRPTPKRLLFKFAGYLSVVGMILLVLGGSVAGSGDVSSCADQPSAAIQTHSVAKERVLNDHEAQVTAAALSWLLDGFTAVDPKLVFASDWRVIHDNRLPDKRIWLKGMTGNLAALTGFLERARGSLERDYGYRLLFNSDAHQGRLNFLLLDGLEVVAVADFTVLSFKPVSVPLLPRPQLAIVIDDLGRSLRIAARFAALPLPLTFAVFPKLRNSRAVASYFVSQHCDIMLHMPMEPRDFPHQDPGPGAIFMAMDESQLKQKFIEDLEYLPGIIGVNNHMGSRLTADSLKMTQVMGVLKERNLFFLDSRTIASSVAYRKAQTVGIPALQRDVFLDNERDVAKIIEQFRVLVAIARIKKSAIGIGHPYPETLKALTSFAKIAESAGVKIVAVRKLLPQERISASQ